MLLHNRVLSFIRTVIPFSPSVTYIPDHVNIFLKKIDHQKKKRCLRLLQCSSLFDFFFPAFISVVLNIAILVFYKYETSPQVRFRNWLPKQESI